MNKIIPMIELNEPLAPTEKLSDNYGLDNAFLEGLKKFQEEMLKKKQKLSKEIFPITHLKDELELAIAGLEAKLESEWSMLSSAQDGFLRHYKSYLSESEQKGVDISLAITAEELKENFNRDNSLEKNRISPLEKLPGAQKIITAFRKISAEEKKRRHHSLVKLKDFRKKILKQEAIPKMSFEEEEKQQDSSLLDSLRTLKQEVSLLESASGNEIEQKTKLSSLVLEYMKISSEENDYVLLKNIEDVFPWWKDTVDSLIETEESSEFLKNWEKHKDSALLEEIKSNLGLLETKKSYKAIKKLFSKRKFPLTQKFRKKFKTEKSYFEENYGGLSKQETLLKFNQDLTNGNFPEGFKLKNKNKLPRKLKKVIRKVDLIEQGKSQQIKDEKKQKLASYIRLLSVMMDYQPTSNALKEIGSELSEEKLRSETGEELFISTEDLFFKIVRNIPIDILDAEDLLRLENMIFTKQGRNYEAICSFISGLSINEEDHEKEIILEFYSEETAEKIISLFDVENKNYMGGDEMFSNAIKLAEDQGVDVFYSHSPVRGEVSPNMILADMIYDDGFSLHAENSENDDENSTLGKFGLKDEFLPSDFVSLLDSADDWHREIFEESAFIYQITFNEQISSEAVALHIGDYLDFAVSEYISSGGEPVAPDVILARALVVNNGDMHRALWDISIFSKALTRSDVVTGESSILSSFSSGYLSSEVLQDFVSKGVTSRELFPVVPAHQSNLEFHSDSYQGELEDKMPSNSKILKNSDPVNLAGNFYHISNILAFLDYLPASGLPTGLVADGASSSEYGFNRLTDQFSWLIQHSQEIETIIDALPTKPESSGDFDERIVIPLSSSLQDLPADGSPIMINGKEYFFLVKGSHLHPYLVAAYTKENLDGPFSVGEMQSALENGRYVEIGLNNENANLVIEAEELLSTPRTSSLVVRSQLILHLFAGEPLAEEFHVSVAEVEELDSVLLIEMASSMNSLEDEVYQTIYNTLEERGDFVSPMGEELEELLLLRAVYDPDSADWEEVESLARDAVNGKLIGEINLTLLSKLTEILKEETGYPLANIYFLRKFIDTGIDIPSKLLNEILIDDPVSIVRRYDSSEELQDVISFDELINSIIKTNSLGALAYKPEWVIEGKVDLTEEQLKEIIKQGSYVFLVNFDNNSDGDWNRVISFSKTLDILEENENFRSLANFPNLLLEFKEVDSDNKLNDDFLARIAGSSPYDVINNFSDGWLKLITPDKLTEILVENQNLHIFPNKISFFVGNQVFLPKEFIKQVLLDDPEIFLENYYGEYGLNYYISEEEVTDILEANDLTDFIRFLENVEISDEQLLKNMESDLIGFFYNFDQENGWGKNIEIERVVSILDSADKLHFLASYPNILNPSDLTPMQVEKILADSPSRFLRYYGELEGDWQEFIEAELLIETLRKYESVGSLVNQLDIISEGNIELTKTEINEIFLNSPVDFLRNFLEISEENKFGWETYLPLEDLVALANDENKNSVLIDFPELFVKLNFEFNDEQLEKIILSDSASFIANYDSEKGWNNFLNLETLVEIIDNNGQMKNFARYPELLVENKIELSKNQVLEVLAQDLYVFLSHFQGNDEVKGWNEFIPIEDIIPILNEKNLLGNLANFPEFFISNSTILTSQELGEIVVLSPKSFLNNYSLDDGNTGWNNLVSEQELIDLLEENNLLSYLAGYPHLFKETEVSFTNEQLESIILNTNINDFINSFISRDGWNRFIDKESLVEILEKHQFYSLSNLLYFQETFLDNEELVSHAQLEKEIIENSQKFLKRYTFEVESTLTEMIGFEKVVSILESNNLLFELVKYPELFKEHSYVLSSEQLESIIVNSPDSFLDNFIGENQWEEFIGIQEVLDVLIENNKIEAILYYEELLTEGTILPTSFLEKLIELDADSFTWAYFDRGKWNNNFSLEDVMDILKVSDNLYELAPFPEYLIGQNIHFTDAEVEQIIAKSPFSFLYNYDQIDGWNNFIEFNKVIEVLEENDEMDLLVDFPDLAINYNIEVTSKLLKAMMENDFYNFQYNWDEGWKKLVSSEDVIKLLENLDTEVLVRYPEFILSLEGNISDNLIEKIILENPIEFVSVFSYDDSWNNFISLERVISILGTANKLDKLVHDPSVINDLISHSDNSNLFFTKEQIKQIILSDPEYVKDNFDSGWNKIISRSFLNEVLENLER